MRYSGQITLLAVFASFVGVPQARADTEATLRQGYVYSQEVASQKLKEMASKIPSSEAWIERAERIRENILRGARLECLPPPCPLRTIRHSRRDFDGYSVENVAFEALPGFFVTGNLYLPINFETPIPGVLAPHGHIENNRRLKWTQYRSAAFARMGAAVFAWDMLGYGESQPFEHTHSQSLRIQTFSSIRALDFLLSLGIVDGHRIGITGASGGGTQTFILSAIDPRINVSAPVVQVSAHFYGGCVCESGMPIHVCGRLETNNVEIASCFAPKPLLLVSVGGDYTSNTPQVEFPYIQRIYSLMGAEGNVENAHFGDEEHDYGASKREAVYRFFAKHLGLNLSDILRDDKSVDESFVRLLSTEELAVFDKANPRPTHAVDSCDEIIRMLDM